MVNVTVCKTCGYAMPEAAAIIHRDTHPQHHMVDIETQKEEKPWTSDADLDAAPEPPSKKSQ